MSHQGEFKFGPHVIDVLGRTRPIEKIWPDGSYNCPFCMAAVEANRKCVGYPGGCSYGTHCQNRACFANPHYPVDRARREYAEHERRREEEAQRAANREWSNRYAEEQRRERAAQIDAIAKEAQTRGACVRCALKDAPYRTKFVKHRGACPLSKR